MMTAKINVARLTARAKMVAQRAAAQEQKIATITKALADNSLVARVRAAVENGNVAPDDVRAIELVATAKAIVERAKGLSPEAQAIVDSVPERSRTSMTSRQLKEDWLIENVGVGGFRRESRMARLMRQLGEKQFARS